MNNLLNPVSLPLHTGSLLELIFYLVTFVYVAFTAVLYYHWSNYAIDKKVSNTTLTIYFILTIPLILIMGILLFVI